MTGASGALYARRLIEVLLERGLPVHLIISGPGWEVCRQELGWTPPPERPAEETLREAFAEREGLTYYDNRLLTAPLASGSAPVAGMVIVPCSMGTLGRIAHSISSSLLERAADVALKEGRPLVVVPRETPVHALHLENMLALSRAGARIVPAMPAFYTRPQTVAELVDFVVGRVLDALGLEHDLYRPWSGPVE
ncbi:MAG: flavin prenyltransferase UbiX [Bacillota bacterium]|nr:flavin prenyltransferase UbiX [Bacillota bacterium]